MCSLTCVPSKGSKVRLFGALSYITDEIFPVNLGNCNG